jgi:hypothetical protein
MAPHRSPLWRCCTADVDLTQRVRGPAVAVAHLTLLTCACVLSVDPDCEVLLRLHHTLGCFVAPATQCQLSRTTAYMQHYI